jgi:hypothetical protein
VTVWKAADRAVKGTVTLRCMKPWWTPPGRWCGRKFRLISLKGLIYTIDIDARNSVKGDRD